MKNAQLKSKFAVVTNSDSPMMSRTKRIAAHMLNQYSKWSDEQRAILEKIAMRGYVVGDIFAVLGAFGKKPSWHTGEQKGICIPILPMGTKNIENAYKGQLDFCLL